MTNTDTKTDSKPSFFQVCSYHLGSALLLWFMAFSLGLLLAVCFQTDIHDDRGVPVVLNNLWKITVYALPIYGVCYFATKSRSNAVCSGTIVVVLVALMSDLISLPSSEHLTFVKSDSEITQKEVETDSLSDDSEILPDDTIMELPDEL